MSERDIYMQLFNISVNTYYLWKKQERPIVKLLEKYFLKEELEEFLETGEILKLEFINDINMQYSEIVKKFLHNMNKFKGQKFSSVDIEMCLNIINFKVGEKATQLGMIQFLINKDNDKLLKIEDENLRCALISSLSILSELEFKMLRKESFSMFT